MAAAHYQLDNLCAIIDRNNLQIDGRTSEVMEIARSRKSMRPSAGMYWRLTATIWRRFYRPSSRLRA